MSMNGIDISSWQTGIDLSKVPCDFVIIKATEGVTLGKSWEYIILQEKTKLLPRQSILLIISGVISRKQFWH